MTSGGAVGAIAPPAGVAHDAVVGLRIKRAVYSAIPVPPASRSWHRGEADVYTSRPSPVVSAGRPKPSACGRVPGKSARSGVDVSTPLGATTVWRGGWCCRRTPLRRSRVAGNAPLSLMHGDAAVPTGSRAARGRLTQRQTGYCAHAVITAVGADSRLLISQHDKNAPLSLSLMGQCVAHLPPGPQLPKPSAR
jgi:hypothetical protein